MRRNQIAKLSEYTEFRCGWFGVLFYHLCRVAELKSHANHFFRALTETPVGRLWNASKARQIQNGARRWALGSTREPPEKQGTRSFDRVLQGWSVRRTSSVYPRISIAVFIASAISSV